MAKRIISKRAKIVYKVSAYSIVTNILLSIFKVSIGFIGNSKAMISDGLHSASDVFSTFIVLAGIKISQKDADKSHPYGHEKFENITAIMLAVILLVLGLGIGIAGGKQIISGEYKTALLPDKITLIAAIISIATKEAMFWYTRAAGKKIDSSALMADAWHHRSDALSSVGSFIGILGARIGYPICDAIASIVIALIVVKVSIDIFIDSVHKLTDESGDGALEEEIISLLKSIDGVMNIDDVKTRKFSNRLYVDVEISADGNLKLEEAHDIAETIHISVEKRFPTVKHCMVHVNPFGKKH